MKDDIDSILDSMLSGGRLTFGSEFSVEEGVLPSAHADKDKIDESLTNTENPSPIKLEVAVGQPDKSEEYTELLKEVEGINQKVQSTLQQEIDALTRETQKQLEGLGQQITQDEIEQKQPRKLEMNENIPSIKKEIKKAFQVSQEAVNAVVVGQGDFVSAIGEAFRRPLIVGIKPKMPSSCTLIIGSNGTGRHLTLENFTKSLQENGVLNDGGVSYLDLSKYKSNTSEKVFVQDLYAAVSGRTQVVAFENFEQCHNSVLKLVSDLFVDGDIHLDGRYVEQKGVLVEIGNTLVKNAVSSVSAEGKYLFFITNKNEGKLMDAFGSRFLDSYDDICRTVAFTGETLKEISKKLLHTFCADVRRSLACALTFEETAAEMLALKYVPDMGIHSLTHYIAELTRALENHKLKHAGAETGVIECQSEELYVRLTDTNVFIPISEDGERIVNEVKDELREIIGLANVKEYIYALEDNFKIQQMRRERGLKAEIPSMHMIFTGNPGTGKTTIARIVSRYLKAIGVLSGGQLVEVTRADLVGRYVGHTAPLTQNAIQSALGGVLFIDEAYALYRGKDDSFGLEAIDTLVKGMEDYRDKLLVILAGYSYEMGVFLESNSGLKSRFPNHIEFPDYTAQELVNITKNILKHKGYMMEADCEPALYVHYDIMQKTGDPRTNGNGRMARNKVEEAIVNCSKRNLASPGGEMDLELLKLEDFKLSNKSSEMDFSE